MKESKGIPSSLISKSLIVIFVIFFSAIFLRFFYNQPWASKVLIIMSILFFFQCGMYLMYKKS